MWLIEVKISVYSMSIILQLLFIVFTNAASKIYLIEVEGGKYLLKAEDDRKKVKYSLEAKSSRNGKRYFLETENWRKHENTQDLSIDKP